MAARIVLPATTAIADERKGIYLDTSTRIAWLCDADKRLVYPDFRILEDVTLRDIQIEYAAYSLGVTLGESMERIKNALYNLLSESCLDALRELGMHLIDIPSSKNVKWYSPKWCEVYRRSNYVPVMRRMRCRWRARESRHVFSGLSPSMVIDDEPWEAQHGG